MLSKEGNTQSGLGRVYGSSIGRVLLQPFCLTQILAANELHDRVLNKADSEIGK